MNKRFDWAITAAAYFPVNPAMRSLWNGIEIGGMVLDAVGNATPDTTVPRDGPMMDIMARWHIIPSSVSARDVSGLHRTFPGFA